MYTLDLRLRPLKIAFYLDYTKKEQLQKAIEVNNFLWCSSWNPFIPCLEKIKDFHSDIPSGYTAEQLFKSYIEVYDPDFVVLLDPNDEQTVKPLLNSAKVINIEKIEAPILKYGYPGYGIGILEVLNAWFEAELKYVLKKEPQIIIPNCPNNDLLLSAFFGSVHKDITTDIQKNYKEYFVNFDEPETTLSNYLSYSGQDVLFLRRILAYKASINRHFVQSDSINFLFLDSNSPVDLIDYMNVRALGLYVIPVSIDHYLLPENKIFLFDEIEKNFTVPPGKHLPNRYSKILKGRSIADERFIEISKSLYAVETLKNKFFTQSYLPRIYNAELRRGDGVSSYEFSDSGKKVEASNIDEEVQFTCVSPPFELFTNRGYREDVFANDLDIRTYGGSATHQLAEVVPYESAGLLSHYKLFMGNEYRVGQKGITLLCEGGDQFNFKIPKSHQLIQDWFLKHGIELDLTEKGKIAKQLFKQLGGYHGLNDILTYPELLDYLISFNKTSTENEDISKDGEDIGSAEISEHNFGGRHYNAVLNQLTVISKQINWYGDQFSLLAYLLGQNILIIGMNINCPTCSKWSWYPLNKLGYKMDCNVCLDNFSIPDYNPKKNTEWAYRVNGPFNLPKKADGAFSVLLTLNFFNNYHRGRTSPMFTAKVKSDNLGILKERVIQNGKEVNKGKDDLDLVLFYQDSFGSGRKVDLIFSECKSNNEFVADDIERMQAVLNRFPESTIVFSSTKIELTQNEIVLIQEFVDRNKEITSQIMILTGTELQPGVDRPLNIFSLWEKKDSERLRKLGKQYGPLDIQELCKYSQEFYLIRKEKVEN